MDLWVFLTPTATEMKLQIFKELLKIIVVPFFSPKTKD